MSSHLGGIATTTSWMETCLPSVYSSLEPAVCIICLRNVSWPKHVSNILLWAQGQRSIHRPISPLALVSTRCCPSTARPLSGRTSDARGTFHEKNDLQNGHLDVIPMLQHFGCQTVSPKFHCHKTPQEQPKRRAAAPWMVRPKVLGSQVANLCTSHMSAFRLKCNSQFLKISLSSADSYLARLKYRPPASFRPAEEGWIIKDSKFVANSIPFT